MAHIVHARRLAALGAAAALAASIVGGSVARAGTTVPADDGAEAVVATFPLTGLPVPDPATYTPRPALVVKIDNVNAQPQAGLNEADIVYEEIVEGATRFAAVFNSTDSDPVGPIRSGRIQDVHLFGSFVDPVFVYSGANPGVNQALRDAGWRLLTEDDGMWRESGRSRPHNLFGNTSDFFARGADSAPAVPQFQYGVESGAPVTSINLDMAGRSVTWGWHADDGLFYRSVNGREHRTTTGQFSTNNVIVLLVEYGRSANDGNPEAQATGSGDVIVYAGGLKTVGTWTRPGTGDVFTLTDADGQPILLRPGRTIVHLARAGTNVSDDAA